MIKLEIPRKDEVHLAIVDKLTNLALAHQVRVNPLLKLPLLTDGKARFEGPDSIEAYLNETEEELHAWWYCAC
ncbi:MAG: hypothetical protein AAF597_16855 [Bacteroidota bacterium]